MSPIRSVLAVLLLFAIPFSPFARPIVVGQSFTVGHFTKVVVSPYIQVDLVAGETESVTINSLIVDSSKLHVEVSGGTLRLYLDDAKEVPHRDKQYDEKGHKQTFPLYPKHAVLARITFKSLEGLSFRGEETQLCESPVTADRFTLAIYGGSRVIFTEMHVQEMHTTVYG